MIDFLKNGNHIPKELIDVMSNIPIDILKITNIMGIGVYSCRDFGYNDPFRIETIDGKKSILIDTNLRIEEQRFNLAKALYYYIECARS